MAGRWTLISFGTNEYKRDKFAQHMPLLNCLRIAVGPKFHKEWGISAPWLEWATGCITSAMAEGYDVFLDPCGGAEDYANPLIGSMIDDLLFGVDQFRVPTGKKKKKEKRPEGKLLGVLLDAEWEATYPDGSPKYVPGGWQGYVQYVSPIIESIRTTHPEVPIGGPGGTHSDDETFIPLMDGLRDRGTLPDFGTFHVYFDKGWPEAEDRMAWVKTVFNGYGIETIAITETGVTGEKSKAGGFLGVGSGGRVYNDGLVSDNPEENYCARFERMKGLFDVDSRWIALMIYQETEGEVDDGSEEHGHGFGVFRWDWTPKDVVRFFQ